MLSTSEIASEMDTTRSGSLDTSDCEDGPPVSKRTKLSGAATYKTKFTEEWKKEFPFITSVHGDPFR